MSEMTLEELKAEARKYGYHLVKDIQNFVKKTTAPYKYPRVVDFVTELPKTISGKIKRNEIRAKDAK